jgi:hypothetical protein
MTFGNCCVRADQRNLAVVGWWSGQGNLAVVVDSWWSGDYAKEGCEQAKSYMWENRSLINQIGCQSVTACTDMMPRYLACTTGPDPNVQAHQYEDRLMTQFAINPSCEGATFARYYGSDNKTPSAAERAVLDKSHWALIIDFVVGASKQSWSLQYGREGNLLQGDSETEAKMASDVCAIVLGRGGSLAR